MESFLYSLLPTVFIILIMLSFSGVLVLAKKGLPWGKKKRNPLTSQFLRSPGQSIQTQVEDIKYEAILILFQLVVVPLSLFLIPLISYPFTGNKINIITIITLSVLGISSIIYWLYKLFYTMKRLQQIRLGYKGEVAVGQELNQLMLKGYQVFHDFPAEKFNIDHIVVGSTGVFAVETKTRSKPITNNRTNDARLEYDGKILKFPNWSETQPIEQANKQAKWLKKWLSDAIGDQVFVEPVLAIPGWYIERKSPFKPYIYNGKCPEQIFLKVNNYPISDELIKRICHQLDAKCRDIAPKSYVDEKNS